MGDQVPPRVGGGQAIVEPAFLRRAHDAALGKGFGAERGERVAVKLVVAILAGVEYERVEQVAIARAAIHLHVAALRHGAAAQGHVFVIGLHGHRAAEREGFGGVPS
jgi:hypothetical protein